MKRLLNRRRASWLLYYTGVVPLIAFAQKWLGLGGPLYLTGHRVVADAHDPSDRNAIDRTAVISGHAITARDLDRRVRFLKRLRPVGDPSTLARGGEIDRAFYLTFDDGYLDNLRHAAPVLRDHGVKAVIFVVSELLDNPCRLPWWDAWGEGATDSASVATYLKRCGEKKQATRGLLRDGDAMMASDKDRLYFSFAEAGQNETREAFYLSSHGWSHANLQRLTESEITEEVDRGIGRIASLPGYLPLFAYPFGSYDERVVSHLKSRGDIAMAFATGRGMEENRYTQRRINLNLQPFHLFAAECVGMFSWPARLRRLLRGA